jgi:hypothetical protein
MARTIGVDREKSGRTTETGSKEGAVTGSHGNRKEDDKEQEEEG